MVYKIGNRKEDLNGKRIHKIATGEKGDVYKCEWQTLNGMCIFKHPFFYLIGNYSQGE